MLGRIAKGVGGVAKGVGGLAKGVAGVALGEARAALTAVPDDEAEVESCLQRISNALVPEYRREAMGQLKDLLVDNPKAQMAFGSMGIPVLLSVLREDRDDLQLLQGALEALLAATAAGSHAPQQQHAEDQAAAINAEQLARRSENISLLLGLLEDEPVGISDFYVRYHTVQLLTSLLNHCPFKLQEAILATPMSVVRLTELLAERSEVIRNESLLLLVALTRFNVEVQKIAAFEGAFDRVAAMLQEEGGLAGGVVVQDCIELMNNLLRGNAANQRLFREMGHIVQLPRLLSAAAAQQQPAGASSTQGALQAADALAMAAAAAGQAAGHGQGEDGPEASLELGHALSALAAAGQEMLTGPASLPRQKAANMLLLLETVGLLLAPPVSAAEDARIQESQNRSANQSKVLGAGGLDALLAVALRSGGVPSPVVRTQALHTIGDLVASNKAAQDQLAAATVLPATGEPMPALQAALHVSLHAVNGHERSAAGHIVASYCRSNQDGQLLLASMISRPAPSSNGIAAPGAGGPVTHGSFSAELMAALLGSTCNSAAAVGNQASNVGNMGASGWGASAASTSGRPGGSSSAPGGAWLACARAAAMVQYVLQGNANAKQKLLSVYLDLAGHQPGAPPELLLPKIVRQLTEALRAPPSEAAAANYAACWLLRLLAVWLHECQPAVASLVDSGASHLPLLVDLTTGRQGPAAPPTPAPGAGTPACTAGIQAAQDAAMVPGLTACVMGICMLYGKPVSQGTGAESARPGALGGQGLVTKDPEQLVTDVVMSRVGLSTFFRRLEELKRCSAFASAMQVPAAALPSPLTRAAVAAATAPSEEATQAANAAEEAPLDRGFTQLVSSLDERVRARTMESFSRPAGHKPGQAPEALELQGDSDAARLAHAAQLLQRLSKEGEELRARNKALAEDLFRLTQSMAARGGMAPGHGHQGGPEQGTSAGGAAASAAASGAADVEARVGLELRANRAEMEVATLKQQLEVLAARLSQAEADASAAREAAAAAHSVAVKAEADLADLSGAYNTLEAHAFNTEAQLRSAQGALAATQAQLQAARTALPAAPPPPMVDEAVLQQRIDAAVQEALARAEADNDEAMTDLLVCLGQEERKVQLLSDTLSRYGVGVDALLATVAEEGGQEDEGDGVL